MVDFDSFKLLTFDCYGTLIDWEIGIRGALRPILSDNDITFSDEQILETYAEIESEIEHGPYRAYHSILRQVVARMGERLGFMPSGDQLSALVESIPSWPPFDDTVKALKKLKTKYRLGIISNIDDDLFAMSNELLKVEFDYVITAQQVGAYKPSLRVFDYALGKFDEPKEKILHVAQSLYHDHAPAKEIGLTSVWINRRRLVPGRGATPPAEVAPETEFPDLASFAEACGL
jgi:2-haloacid dehalogenase